MTQFLSDYFIYYSLKINKYLHNFKINPSFPGGKLEALMEKIHQEFTANPPLPGAFTPKRGNVCAARYSLDDHWYRAKVEKVQDDKVAVLYIDYGNREVS